MNIIFANNFFQDLWIKLNELIAKLNFDDIFMDFYIGYVQPMAELFKWLLLLLLIVLLIFGIISFIKKTFKVFIVVAIITSLILFFSNK